MKTGPDQLDGHREKATVVDVLLSGAPWPRTVVAAIFAVPVVVIALVVANHFLFQIGVGSRAKWTIVVIGIVGLFVGVTLIMRADRRRTLSVLAANFDPETFVADARREYYNGTIERFVIHDLHFARKLVHHGHVNTVIRFSGVDFTAIHPVEHTFEALSLDEGNDRLADFEWNADARVDGKKSSMNENPRAGLPGGVRRVGKFLGGWSTILVVAIVPAMQIVQNWSSGGILLALPLVLLGGFFLLGLYRLAGSLVAKQMFAVPGGLIMRRAGWWDRQWRVSLFRRTESVLLAAPTSTPEVWCVAVADTTRADTFFATDREVHVLLRAWTSPLEPPSVDRLGDLES